jgi:hypothetical protein
MSPISQLRDFFPYHNLGILTRTLEASNGDVQKAADYLVDGATFAYHDAKSSISGCKHATISSTRVNVAEKRLANPAFRQPLKQPATTLKLKLSHLIRKQESDTALTNDKIVKEEADTAVPPTTDKVKPEPVEDDLENTTLQASTPLTT